MYYRLLIDCQDRKGLVYKISKVLFEEGFNIENQQEFVDRENQKFFFRAVIEGEVNRETLLEKLKRELGEECNIRLVRDRKKRLFLMATKEAHGLGDILIKWFSGDLPVEILGVVANRENLRELVEKFGIPFYYIPAEGKSRVEHEKEMLEVIAPTNPDYIILAKFMRILTPYFVEKFPNRIINIHHSFLPAFIGANPYKQAYERGVKIIGATAHFVNNNLDDGPIIEQDVIRVNHQMSWQEMRNLGRDIEKVVLGRAIKLVIEDRVFIYGNKTIIL
ncbi:MAG: formyltetrahydrofolate deformylase [Epsilonproteobacteria bacterium]|jgi:formyltetrahydrofolate deformylase|nr:formyltetrahydrofolate deformylase [Campylobacterota bacterium]NPA89095.1 formyltetrahydrofolate deformylase [Campylobacterota bacterium]